MVAIVIHEELAERLHAIARRENRTVEDVLSDLLDRYAAQPDMSVDESLVDPLAAMIGMFDDDITDLLSTVRETMDACYRDRK
jgi:hypothetical protein